MIKAVLFDADYTLYTLKPKLAYKEMFDFLGKNIGLDSSEIKAVWQKCLNNILSSKNSKDVSIRSREYLLCLVLDKLGVRKQKINELVDKSLDIFLDNVLSNLREKDSTFETISFLTKSGKFRLVIVSDEFKSFLERKLDIVFGDWNKYFEFAISSDIAGEMKPSENYYKIALEKLGVKPSEVAVIGDSWQRDLEIPHRIGMMTILISDKKDGDPLYFISELSQIKEILGA